MVSNERDTPAMKDPEGQLEKAFIDEFLRARGFDTVSVRALPQPEAQRLLSDASIYAAVKLAEVEARAHYVHDIHRAE